MITINDEFVGGSLNDIIAQENFIVKRYSGELSRGHEKLQEEYKWFLELPSALTKDLPFLFPKVLRFNAKENPRITELYMSRIHRTSLSKSILQNKITPDNAKEIMDLSLDILLTRLYTIRSSKIEPRNGYIKYHSSRLDLVRKYLKYLPYMSPILNSTEILVNDIRCPSINEFFAWLDLNAPKIFLSNKVVSVHGNFHLDNILFDLYANDYNKITFIDPRGDLLGYPHYDIAKLLTALEGYYDEIHYGEYEIDEKIRENAYEVILDISQEQSQHYEKCLGSLIDRLDNFAEAEDAATPHFLWSVYTAECIHVLSFCFYHAYRGDTSPNRIRAFISVFALLAHRLLETWEAKEPSELPKFRLQIHG